MGFYDQWMTDTNGNRNYYREPAADPRKPAPQFTHPLSMLRTNWTGNGLHPCTHIPLTEWRERYKTALGHYPEDGEGVPIDGDWTARYRRLQCWDDVVYRTKKKTFTGTEPCEEPTCPHPQPHTAASWGHSEWPRFQDIAHAHYPGGVIPVPCAAPDEIPPDDVSDEPVQLDLLDFLETA